MAFLTAIALILFVFISPSIAFSLEKTIVDWVKSSSLLAKLHQEHVASPGVQHMMKATPLVKASDDDKIAFASGPWGNMVADVMKAEQELLGDWKLEKIKEAAGENFAEEASLVRLKHIVKRAPVTVFSFVDCPWCLLAKKMLQEEPYNLDDGNGTLQIIELEDLAWEGKELRAVIGLSTGRTSMPAIFINGKGIGGFTDGFEVAEMSRQKRVANGPSGSTQYVPSAQLDLRTIGAPGLRAMHESGELQKLIIGQ
eukprot:CAMPEP_0197718114 /NCGR_PEP_ID=MMETSP1434-20131217/2398_1 /TAXON_ID=265543 /ORGANISM="Minutocellus polymorphus, Strain CCMP3303" /LENGTH=254 /DNA_ID=CAMNT_0043302735 /DNA_START=27 /DNA_END=791 /DNA_ORIENTATION=-